MMWRALLVAAVLSVASGADAARIKDIASLQGVRENQLVGYGIVVGLKGTGDTLRNAPFTEQSLQSMLDRMGVNVRGIPLRSRNVAAVIVTADLPPFANRGSRMDLTVSAMGDASSLLGGTLIMTPLRGADNEVYAVGQGAVAVSGFAIEGAAQSVSQGTPTAGRIPNGALIEREIPEKFGDMKSLVLELKNPDFATVIRMVDVINSFSWDRYRGHTAFERDFRSIALRKPRNMSTTRFIAEIGELQVQPDTPARVVIDERTGTVVIGRDVQIATVAVTHGNLTVRITEMPIVSQPGPFAPKSAETVVTPNTAIDVNEPGAQVAILQGTNLQRLVRGLNQIGLKPSGIIAILQAIKSAGALQADIIVQ